MTNKLQQLLNKVLIQDLSLFIFFLLLNYKILNILNFKFNIYIFFLFFLALYFLHFFCKGFYKDIKNTYLFVFFLFYFLYIEEKIAYYLNKLKILYLNFSFIDVAYSYIFFFYSTLIFIVFLFLMVKINYYEIYLNILSNILLYIFFIRFIYKNICFNYILSGVNIETIKKKNILLDFNYIKFILDIKNEKFNKNFNYIYFQKRYIANNINKEVVINAKAILGVVTGIAGTAVAFKIGDDHNKALRETSAITIHKNCLDSIQDTNKEIYNINVKIYELKKSNDKSDAHVKLINDTFKYKNELEAFKEDNLKRAQNFEDMYPDIFKEKSIILIKNSIPKIASVFEKII